MPHVDKSNPSVGHGPGVASGRGFWPGPPSDRPVVQPKYVPKSLDIDILAELRKLGSAIGSIPSKIGSVASEWESLRGEPFGGGPPRPPTPSSFMGIDISAGNTPWWEPVTATAPVTPGTWDYGPPLPDVPTPAQERTIAAEAAQMVQDQFDAAKGRVSNAIDNKIKVTSDDLGILEKAKEKADVAKIEAASEEDYDKLKGLASGLGDLLARAYESNERISKAGITKTAAVTAADLAEQRANAAAQQAKDFQVWQDEQTTATQTWRAAQEQATRDWQTEQSQQSADASMLAILMPLLFQAQQQQGTERARLIQEQQTKEASSQFAELAQQFFPNIDAASLQGIDPSLMMLLFSLMQQSGQGQVSATPRTIYR